jgi:hypothetical protein
MAALSAARNVLLLDSRLRGNDEANGLFWFKNREFNPIRTVLGLMCALIQNLTRGIIQTRKLLLKAADIEKNVCTCFLGKAPLSLRVIPINSRKAISLTFREIRRHTLLLMMVMKHWSVLSWDNDCNKMSQIIRTKENDYIATMVIGIL